MCEARLRNFARFLLLQRTRGPQDIFSFDEPPLPLQSPITLIALSKISHRAAAGISINHVRLSVKSFVNTRL